MPRCSCPEEIGEIYVEDEVETEIAEEEEEEELRPSVDPEWTAHANRYRHGNRLSLDVPERVQSSDRIELQSPIVIELGDLEEEEEDWRILQKLPEGETQSVLKTLPKYACTASVMTMPRSGVRLTVPAGFRVSAWPGT